MTIEYKIKFEDGGVTIAQSVDVGPGEGGGPGDNPYGKGSGAPNPVTVTQSQGAGQVLGVVCGPLVIGTSAPLTLPTPPAKVAKNRSRRGNKKK